MTEPEQYDPQTKSPVGYCPHCNYQLLSAGTCPECGNHIAAARIRSTPRVFSARVWAKRLLVVALALALFFAGLWAFETGQFYRIYSNTSLIETYPTGKRACEEIARRIRSGAMSRQEIEDLVTKSFTVDISTPSTIPHDQRIKLECHIDAGPQSLFHLRYKDPIILVNATIDNQPADIESSFNSWATKSNGRSGDQQFRTAFTFPHAAAGQTHDLDITLRLMPRAFDPTLNAALPPSVLSGFDIQKKLQVKVE